MRWITSFFFFFNDTATTEIYTLSLHDALPIFDDYSSIHDSWSNLTRVTDALTGSLIDHNVDVGATSLFWFVINTPGTYFFACHMVDTNDFSTDPATWVIHQGHAGGGMWGTLVVS